MSEQHDLSTGELYLGMNETAEEYAEHLLRKLLDWRVQNPGFTFHTRSGTDSRSQEKRRYGWWFQGNENYVFAGMFALSGFHHKTKSIGFVVDKLGRVNTKPICEIQVAWPGELDPAKKALYNRIVREIPGFKRRAQDVYFKRLDGESSVGQLLEDFLRGDYQDIRSFIEEAGLLDEALVGEEDFTQSMLAITEVKRRADIKEEEQRSKLQAFIHEVDNKHALRGLIRACRSVLVEHKLNEDSQQVYAAISSGMKVLHITVGSAYIANFHRHSKREKVGFYVDRPIPSLDAKYGRRLNMDVGSRGVWYSGFAEEIDASDFKEGMTRKATDGASQKASPYRTQYQHLHNNWIVRCALDDKVMAEFFGDQETVKEQPARQIWGLAAGSAGKDWQEWLEKGHCGIGWDLGKPEELSSAEIIGDRLKVRYDNDSEPTHNRRTVFDFIHSVMAGDVVVAIGGKKTVCGIGIVTGELRHQPQEFSSAYAREVMWLHSDSQDIDGDKGFSRITLVNITEKIDLLAEIENAFDLMFDELALTEPDVDEYRLQDLLSQSFLKDEHVSPILTGLKAKKNIILQGPPGTGKTYIAKRLAYALMEEEAKDRIEVVQFHQSYSYEDFIQGFRPKEGGGFERSNGVFFRFCDKARRDPGRYYFFLIDEINRGNLSKIFGELMMLIEADKRGESNRVQLTYSKEGEHFHIPDNVYIIGTMNTADRSLALVDYALRRRFAFFHMPPQFNEKFEAYLQEEHSISESMVKHIVAKVTALNRTITADKNLGDGFEIGHSYFCTDVPTGSDEETWFSHIVDHEIGPQLLEYWFDDKPQAQAQIDLLKA
jgi:MoxR-like ATPase